jgi:hypothetical protein
MAMFEQKAAAIKDGEPAGRRTGLMAFRGPLVNPESILGPSDPDLLGAR